MVTYYFLYCTLQYIMKKGSIALDERAIAKGSEIIGMRRNKKAKRSIQQLEQR